MNKLNIPKIIKVGYQERSNTYTGKLAYVIYIDEKGKVRKETSWNQWRDNKINPDDFNNEPTEGFVLNKNGGGGRGWDGRNEFIRVYDPRGFEFEISLANLLFILQECTSSKGKGLEGEFVYGWDGTSLVLIPTCCKEYKESIEFTALKSKKILRKEMVEGHTYQNKKMEKLIYLGRHCIRDLNKYTYYSNNNMSKYEKLQLIPSIRKDIFYDLTDKCFSYLNGLASIAEEIDDTTYEKYAEVYMQFNKGEEVAEFDSIGLISLDKEKIKKEDSTHLILIEIEKNKFIQRNIDRFYSGNNYNYRGRGESGHHPDSLENLIRNKKNWHSNTSERISKKDMFNIYSKYNWYTPVFKFKNSKTTGIYYYEQQ